MRYIAISALLISGTTVHAVAQDSRDPDRSVPGSGIQVEGWRGRTDRGEQRISDVRFVDWNGGYRLTSGPHAILWRPSHRGSEDYTVSARLTKLPDSISSQEESYGLFIAGTDLAGPRQNYLYCVVFGTGTVMVQHRAGSQTATLLGKTANPAIAKMGTNGATDEVALWVRGGRVGCSVNGVEVFSAVASDMIGPGKLVSTDGVYGVRASHNVDLVIEGLALTRSP